MQLPCGAAPGGPRAAAQQAARALTSSWPWMPGQRECTRCRSCSGAHSSVNLTTNCRSSSGGASCPGSPAGSALAATLRARGDSAPGSGHGVPLQPQCQQSTSGIKTRSGGASCLGPFADVPLAATLAFDTGTPRWHPTTHRVDKLYQGCRSVSGACQLPAAILIAATSTYASQGQKTSRNLGRTCC